MRAGHYLRVDQGRSRCTQCRVGNAAHRTILFAGTVRFALSAYVRQRSTHRDVFHHCGGQRCRSACVQEPKHDNSCCGTKNGANTKRVKMSGAKHVQFVFKSELSNNWSQPKIRGSAEIWHRLGRSRKLNERSDQTACRLMTDRGPSAIQFIKVFESTMRMAAVSNGLRDAARWRKCAWSGDSFIRPFVMW